MKWQKMPFLFSRRSSRPRNHTHISCIIDRFFTAEAPRKPKDKKKILKTKREKQLVTYKGVIIT